MGIKFGEIDASQILENEFRINVLERTLDWIVVHNFGKLSLPSQEAVGQIKKEVLGLLQKKYPNSGIQLKEQEQQPVAG